MTPDNFELPYSYARNNHAGSMKLLVWSIVASVVMAAARFFGFVPLPWAVCAIPVALFGGRLWLFSLIHNAVHWAGRSLAADSQLDGIVRNHMEQTQKMTLTPAMMARMMEPRLEFDS